MYIILTSKPMQYRSEPTPGLRPLAAYAYVYAGRHVATFVIAALECETRVRIVETTEAPTVNLVPTKFFERFETQEAALQSLHALTDAQHSDARLIPEASFEPIAP